MTNAAPYLGNTISIHQVQPGKFYAVEEKAGYIYCLAALVGGESAMIILSLHETTTLDRPPVWVWSNSLPSSSVREIIEAHIEPAHASGTLGPTNQPVDDPKHGDLLEDDRKRLFITLKRRLEVDVFSLETGECVPKFDADLVYRRWRLRQPQNNGIATLAEFEST